MWPWLNVEYKQQQSDTGEDGTGETRECEFVDKLNKHEVDKESEQQKITKHNKCTKSLKR